MISVFCRNHLFVIPDRNKEHNCLSQISLTHLFGETPCVKAQWTMVTLHWLTHPMSRNIK